MQVAVSLMRLFSMHVDNFHLYFYFILLYFVICFLKILELSFQETEKLLEDRFRGYVECARKIVQVISCLFIIDFDLLEFVLKTVYKLVVFSRNFCKNYPNARTGAFILNVLGRCFQADRSGKPVLGYRQLFDGPSSWYRG